MQMAKERKPKPITGFLTFDSRRASVSCQGYSLVRFAYSRRYSAKITLCYSFSDQFPFRLPTSTRSIVAGGTITPVFTLQSTTFGKN
jgi:hypothetical protein